MCTVIVTIRTVLWYVTSLSGTLLILVAMFTNKWLEGHVEASNFNSLDSIVNTAKGVGTSVLDGDLSKALTKDVGLFLNCKEIQGKKFFEGECIPDLEQLETMFTELKEDTYPHAWRGAIICFVFGLFLMIVTDLFAF